MLKNLGKVLIKAVTVLDVLKSKLEIKAADITMQTNNKSYDQTTNGFENNSQSSIKEKAMDELFDFLNEINYRSQVNETQIKGFIKSKLIELTNNAILDSVELNNIRSEIATLKAEVLELKTEVQILKRPKSWFKL